MDVLRLPSLFMKYSLEQRKEKLSIGPISEGKHLTIHFGTNSKIFDIHITDDINKTYESIVKIKYFSLFRILISVSKEIMTYFLNKENFNYINIGKLRRYNCVLLPLELNSNFSKIINKNKKGNYFRLKKSVHFDDLSKLLIELDERDLNCNSFLVYKIYKNNIKYNGILLKRRDKVSKQSYLYVSQKKYNRLNREILKIFIEIISKNNSFGIESFINELKKRIGERGIKL